MSSTGRYCTLHTWLTLLYTHSQGAICLQSFPDPGMAALHPSFQGKTAPWRCLPGHTAERERVRVCVSVCSGFMTSVSLSFSPKITTKTPCWWTLKEEQRRLFSPSPTICRFQLGRVNAVRRCGRFKDVSSGGISYDVSQVHFWQSVLHFHTLTTTLNHVIFVKVKNYQWWKQGAGNLIRLMWREEMLSDLCQTATMDDIRWPGNDVSGTHDLIAHSEHQVVLSPPHLNRLTIFHIAGRHK